MLKNEILKKQAKTVNLNILKNTNHIFVPIFLSITSLFSK